MDFHDPVAAMTHLGFALWCLFAGLILFRLTRRHPPGHRLAVGVYALSAVALYTCSGLFHSLRYDSESDPQYEFFRRLDLSAIFALIAGSCVPICVYVLPKWWGRASLALQIGSATVGIVLVWSMEEVVTQTLIFVYVGMGLVARVPFHIHVRQWCLGRILLMLLFAAFYVLGAVAQAVQWPSYYHIVLHIADMIATLLHSILLVKYTLPYARPASISRSAPIPATITAR